jgi:hypothetical protein
MLTSLDLQMTAAIMKLFPKLILEGTRLTGKNGSGFSLE